jgi:protein-disulfide isomerase/uncharacterized membrane protein
MEQKNLTLNGLTGKNVLFILNAVAMIGVSIYLTSHFYDVLYPDPSKLGGPSTLCNISNLFNCDAATYSKISNIAGVPISFFGLVVGALFLFSSLMPSEALEKTSSAISKYNFIGCIGLFLFSLGVLGTLCPFCTVYYLLSGISFYLLSKSSLSSWKPDLKISIGWGVVLLLGSFFMFQTTKGKQDFTKKMSASVVEQYRKLPDLGEPDVESPFKIHMATEKWMDAPLRLTVFSDFECPFCQKVAEQVPELIRKYKTQINVQYMFYPLDSKCNSNMERPMHKNACDAASLAACDEKKFVIVHDEIFENQSKIDHGFLTELAKKHQLENCMNNPELTNKVITSINQGLKYQLKSTPTLILNGKKIEGSIPNPQFFAIFDDILAGSIK